MGGAFGPIYEDGIGECNSIISFQNAALGFSGVTGTDLVPWV